MVYPEYARPKSQEQINRLGPDRAFIADAKSIFLTHRTYGGGNIETGILTETSWLTFAQLEGKASLRPKSHHYLAWGYLMDASSPSRDPVLKQLDINEGRHVDLGVAFRVSELFHAVHDAKLKLGVGLSHDQNLTTMVSLLLAVEHQYD